GSAYMERGATRLVCSVFGPREAFGRAEFSARGRLRCELAYAPFARAGRDRRAAHVASTSAVDGDALAAALLPLLHLDRYPKALIEVFALVLEDGGAVLATALTCAGAALADAGIEMRDLLAGAAAVRVADELRPDPAADDE